MSAASNFYIRLSASGTRGMNIRTVEVESAISLTDERAFEPMLTNVRTVIFELRFLPYVWVRSDGKPRRPDGVSIFPYLNLERIWSWLITDRRPDGLLRCPDGCKLEQKLLDTVEGPDGKIRRPDGWCWSVWHPDGMTRRPDDWNSGQMGVQTGWHFVRTADRESKFFITLNSGIPIYDIFYIQVFLSIHRMRPIKLTMSLLFSYFIVFN